MRKFAQNFFVGLFLVLAMFMVSEATTRRYTGVEVNNLRATINAINAVNVQQEANMSILTHKLDADAGVTDTTYASLVAPITTASETLSGN